jgi:hypothetical protein
MATNVIITIQVGVNSLGLVRACGILVNNVVVFHRSRGVGGLGSHDESSEAEHFY